MNVITLTGRLGQDPELKRTPAGKYVCKVSLAVADDYDRKKADWIPVIFWEKQAETVHTYLRKGARIGVTGKLQARDYTDKNGNKRTAFEVAVRGFEFLDAKESRGPAADAGFEDIENDDDLPF